jgi:hypothetical protein
MSNRKHATTTQLALMFDLLDKHLHPSWVDENGVKRTSYKEDKQGRQMTDERIGLLIDPKGSIKASMVASRREELYGKLYRIKVEKPKTLRQMIGELQVALREEKKHREDEGLILGARIKRLEGVLRVNNFPVDQELTDIEDVSQVG